VGRVGGGLIVLELVEPRAHPPKLGLENLGLPPQVMSLVRTS